MSSQHDNLLPIFPMPPPFYFQDGKFTLIIATDENRPKKCGFLKDDSEIFLGYRQLKDEGANEPDLVNPPFNPSLVYRYVSVESVTDPSPVL